MRSTRRCARRSSASRSTTPEGRVTNTEGRASGGRSSKHSRCREGAAAIFRGNGWTTAFRSARSSARTVWSSSATTAAPACEAGSVAKSVRWRKLCTVVCVGQLRMSTSRGFGSQPPASETARAMWPPFAACAVVSSASRASVRAAWLRAGSLTGAERPSRSNACRTWSIALASASASSDAAGGAAAGPGAASRTSDRSSLTDEERAGTRCGAPAHGARRRSTARGAPPPGPGAWLARSGRGPRPRAPRRPAPRGRL